MEHVHGHTHRKTWDKWGIALSGACLIHCLLVILLPLLLPAVEMLVDSPWVHRLFGLFVLLTTPLAFLPSYRRHGLHMVLAWAAAGMGLVIAGVFLDQKVSDNWAHVLSVGGSILLVSAHILNIRKSQKHTCC